MSMIRGLPGRSLRVGDIGHLIKMVNDVPVVTPPSEIDRTNAYLLRLTVLQTAADGHATIVVDMTQTRFCDSAGLHTLLTAHKRAEAEGGEVLLVIPSAAVLRVFAITGADRMIRAMAAPMTALMPWTSTRVMRWFR